MDHYPYDLQEQGDGRIIELLRPLLTERRAERIESILDRRTYNLTAALDGLGDTGNMSAILRTCDAFGLQSVHVVTTSPGFQIGRRVSAGSHKWLDIHPHETATECGEALKAQGYQLLAAHLEGAIPIGEADFSRPTALVFGNEQRGVCDAMLAQCDGRVLIPMEGFSRSLNVSVAAGVALYHAVCDRIARLGRTGDLSDDQRRALRERFYRRSGRESDMVIRKANLS